MPQAGRSRSRALIGPSSFKLAGAVSLLCVICALIPAGPTDAHIFIGKYQRIGAVPCGPGTGWSVECFHAIPDADATSLLAAETYVDGPPPLSPTFTFHADYLDWPAGFVQSDLDSTFVTMGDLLNDYISNLSDPNALDLPFDNFLIRATGVVNAQWVDNSHPSLPDIWFDFGILSNDGGRIRLDTTTIFRILLPLPEPSFYTYDAIIPFPGAYPIEVTFFQRNDPTNAVGMDRAGFEFLSCYLDGFELQSDELMQCLETNDGPGTAMAPWHVWAVEDVTAILPGDFDVDNDFDMADYAELQRCHTGPGFKEPLSDYCKEFDLEPDGDVDNNDFNVMVPNFVGPAVCISGP